MEICCFSIFCCHNNVRIRAKQQWRTLEVLCCVIYVNKIINGLSNSLIFWNQIDPDKLVRDLSPLLLGSNLRAAALKE